MRALIATLNEDLDFLFESTGKIADYTKKLVDMDAIRERSAKKAMGVAIDNLGWMLSQNKKVWLKDDQGRFTLANLQGGRSLEIAIRDAAGDALDDAAGNYETDGIPELMKQQGEIEDAAKKMKKARVKIKAVTSPKTGSKGYVITY
jgi:hypothetical protein